jgi:hypothetical protein
LFWVAAALVVGGIGISCAGVALLTIVQLHAPTEQRGRVAALWSLAFTGVTPLSYAVAGLIGQQLGPRGSLRSGLLCRCLGAGYVDSMMNGEAGGRTHNHALRVVANHLVGILRAYGPGLDGSYPP